MPTEDELAYKRTVAGQKSYGTGNASLADYMSREDAERYLDFLEHGSASGLSEAELRGIGQVDDYLALQRVNYDEVLRLRNVGVEGGLSPDFYVGPNGKALPSQYKDWIGTNMQQELLNQADNLQLQNAIKELYRGNSFIGDGGTADAIRFEQQTGLMLGKNGGSHVQKGIDMAKYINNKILTQELSSSDRALATHLLEDLNNALGR